MTTSTLPRTVMCTGSAEVSRPGSQVVATGLLVRWCAAQFTRPLYHRLGAFDLARSGMARALLERNASR